MSIKWKILELEKYSSEQFSDVVSNIHWEATLVEVVNDKVCSARIYGATSLVQNQKHEFVQYENLTEQTVMDWLFENGVDKDLVEETLLQQVEDQKSKSIVSPPWNEARPLSE